MKKMCQKCMLLTFVYASAVWYIASSATEEKSGGQKDVVINFMKVNEKIEYLSEKLEKLEMNLPIGNIANDVEEIKLNMKQMMKNTELLFDLIKTINNQTKDDLASKLSTQCTSICESKVNYWAHETSLKFKESLGKVDFCVQNTSKPCDPNPCLNSGICQLTSYYCANCPYPTRGKHCENLNCNKASRCIQYQSTLYVVFEEHGTWEDAYRKCAREGMRMAMSKDKDTTEFLIGQLKTMYQPAQGRHFFIGLKKNATGEFRWNDGTAVGDYTGGYPNFKGQAGERWAILYLHGGNILWYPQISVEIPKGIYYPFCERDISIR